MASQVEKNMVKDGRSNDKAMGRAHKANASVTPDQVTAMKTKQGGKCSYCGDKLNYSASSRHDNNAPSLERKDNGKQHTAANTKLVCSYCNCARGDKTPQQMKAHAKGMKTGRTKYCPSCKKFKHSPKSQFNKDGSKQDGLASKCTDCSTTNSWKKSKTATKSWKKRTTRW
jgi:hypothetical protein